VNELVEPIVVAIELKLLLLEELETKLPQVLGRSATFLKESATSPISVVAETSNLTPELWLAGMK
jgi:hypothetical protein